MIRQQWKITLKYQNILFKGFLLLHIKIEIESLFLQSLHNTNTRNKEI